MVGKHTAGRVVETDATEALWEKYQAVKAANGADSSAAWDAFFAWWEVVLPWTS